MLTSYVGIRTAQQVVNDKTFVKGFKNNRYYVFVFHPHIIAIPLKAYPLKKDAEKRAFTISNEIT